MAEPTPAPIAALDRAADMSGGIGARERFLARIAPQRSHPGFLLSSPHEV